MTLYKKKEKEVPYLLAPRRRCVYYSKVYSEVTNRWLLAWNQDKQITYYPILYTNSKFSIDLPYNSTDLLPANKHN